MRLSYWFYVPKEVRQQPVYQQMIRKVNRGMMILLVLVVVEAVLPYSGFLPQQWAGFIGNPTVVAWLAYVVLVTKPERRLLSEWDDARDAKHSGLIDESPPRP